MSKINPSSPTEVRVQPLPDGGTCVDVFIPTYGGGVVVSISAQRDADGDWLVTVPTAQDLGIEGYEPGFEPELESFRNGLAYLGAPDAEYDRLPSTELVTERI